VTLVLTFIHGIAFAVPHPLITEDADTEGIGKYQLGLTYEYGHDDRGGTVVNTNQIQAVMTYGLEDNVDIVLTLPYQFINMETSESKISDNGISDITIEVEWRFFETNGFGLGLKPGVQLPTGDDQKGLGSGKTGYHLFFILSKELEQLAFHFNLGYMHNENSNVFGDRTDSWHVSLASEMPITSWMKAVVDIGVERSDDNRSNTPPLYILGGLIFPVNKSLDLDLGAKAGLTDTETDYSLLVGMTLHF
jgi:hypothetical protein